MQTEEVHMVLGQPNTTSAIQEMGDWFEEYKERTNLKAQDIFEHKTYFHALSLKHYNNEMIFL